MRAFYGLYCISINLDVKSYWNHVKSEKVYIVNGTRYIFHNSKLTLLMGHFSFPTLKVMCRNIIVILSTNYILNIYDKIVHITHDMLVSLG